MQGIYIVLHCNASEKRLLWKLRAIVYRENGSIISQSIMDENKKFLVENHGGQHYIRVIKISQMQGKSPFTL